MVCGTYFYCSQPQENNKLKLVDGLNDVWHRGYWLFLDWYTFLTLVPLKGIIMVMEVT